MDELLLRPEDAARTLGVSRAALYELLARGELESVLVGRRSRRVPAAAIHEYIDRLRRERPQIERRDRSQ